MTRTAIVTDSNSGIFQDEAGARGIYVVPMPFYVGGKLYYEGVTMTWDEFFEHLKNGEDISTSTPARGDVTDLWDKLLKDYENIVYIPMSSGLSSSCSMAILAAQDDKYEGRVFVVNNQRISVTQRQSVLDAKEMADRGLAGPGSDRFWRIPNLIQVFISWWTP